jgi:hypothetical protein
MRSNTPRVVALVAAAVMTITSVATVSAFQTASVDGCGVSIGLDRVPAEILSLVVRWPDESVSTVDLPSKSARATESGETPSSYSWSSSSSMSTSTTCVNGECSTTTSHLECDEDGCW